MSPYLIHVENICYEYPDGTKALKDITFGVGPGEAVALVGANGAGKSTLLQQLNGVLLPSSGSVEIGGLTVEKRNLIEIRKLVGMVFGNPDDQLFMPVVAEDVSFGPMNLGWSTRDVRLKTSSALESVGAAHLADRHPFRLSSGEKRRVALASVLVMEPEILVLDEPVSSLDPRSRKMLIELLGKLNQTMLIATHDLDMALKLCERTIILNAGSIAADGPSLELLKDRVLLESNGLELPLSLQN